MDIPAFSVQVEEGGSDEKRGEEKTKKTQILEVFQAKPKADNDLTYGTTPSFNWAGSVGLGWLGHFQ